MMFSKKSKPDPELLALKEELQTAQADLALAYRQFDQALDPELVESCIYQISAVKARCNYLIRSIKEHSPETVLDRFPAAGRPADSIGDVPASSLSSRGDSEGGAAWT